MDLSPSADWSALAAGAADLAANPLPEPSFTSVLCDACDGEGRIIRRPSGGNVWEEIDCGPCPHCHGTGTELRETERRAIEDILTAPISAICERCPFCGGETNPGTGFCRPCADEHFSDSTF